MDKTFLITMSLTLAVGVLLLIYGVVWGSSFSIWFGLYMVFGSIGYISVYKSSDFYNTSHQPI